MPDLAAYHEKHRAEGLVFLAVNTQDNYAAAQKYVSEHAMTFPVLFDAKGQVLYAWSEGALPDTFLIDREGRVVFKWTGQISPAILEQPVTSLWQE